MTYNEIIKALEQIASWICDECKFHGEMCDGDKCEKVVAENALDLINRQKAEIERLEKELMKCKLEKEMLYQTVEEIKSEAKKEFAEELEYFVLNEDIEVVEPKCKDYESYINGANQFRHQIKNGINNLVKEMTEVSENEMPDMRK